MGKGQVPPAARPSISITRCKAAMATSTCAGSGSRVVIRCRAIPGARMRRTAGFPVRRAEKRITSYATAATTGTRAIREAMRTGREGRPRSPKTKIESTTTTSRKLVPQRGWATL